MDLYIREPRVAYDVGNKASQRQEKGEAVHKKRLKEPRPRTV